MKKEMLVFQYGSNSTKKILECRQELQRVIHRVANYYNMSVVCGHRSKAEQDDAVARRVSKLNWPNSKHNANPSNAFDAYPYHARYGSLTEDASVVTKIMQMTSRTYGEVLAFIREEYIAMAQTVKVCAQIEGVALRWGGDWDMDSDRLDQSFNDLAHFELVE